MSLVDILFVILGLGMGWVWGVICGLYFKQKKYNKSRDLTITIPEGATNEEVFDEAYSIINTSDKYKYEYPITVDHHFNWGRMGEDVKVIVISWDWWKSPYEWGDKDEPAK